jgi:hypothetical protein
MLRFVGACLHFHAFSEGAVHQLPRNTPCCDASAAHLEFPGAIGLFRACPEVMFAEAVDLGLEAIRQAETHASLFRATNVLETEVRGRAALMLIPVHSVSPPQ